MMLNLFYKTMRILTWIIIIMAVIFILSKLLPFIGDVINFITNMFKGFMNKLDSLKDFIK